MKKIISLTLCLLGMSLFANESAYEAMQQFGRDNSYKIGFDSEKKRIIAIGVSDFKSDNLKSAMFDEQRMIYLKVAVLSAKAEIIKCISSTMSAREEYASAYGTDLDKGIEAKSSFNSAIEVLSAMPLCGSVVINHAESYNPTTKQYEIVVLALWSAKSEAYAIGKLQPKARPDKQPGTVQDWLQQAIEKNSIGPRTFIDKTGKIWFVGIVAYPVSKGRSIAKSFAAIEAQAMVNFSLYANVASYDKATQMMKKSHHVDGHKSTEQLKTFVQNISQNLRDIKSHATLLAEQEIIHPLAGTKYLTVAYGYAPSVTELKKIAESKDIEDIKKTAEAKNLKGAKSANTTNSGAANTINSDDGVVISYGTGEDRSQAIKNALIEAIRMVNGGAMEANTELQKKFASISAKLNDKEGNASVQSETFEQKIKEKTSGFVKSYHVITLNNISGDRMEAKLKVKVFKFDPDNPRGDAPATVAIFPVSCEDENTVYNTGNNERMSASRIALQIGKEFESQLAATNAFVIIDRANMDKAFKEQDLTIKMVKAKMAKQQEMAKIGNNLSADFLVMPSLIDYKYSAKGKFDPKRGRVKQNKKLLMTLALKVISAADARVVMSEELTVKLNNEQIKALLAEEKNLLLAITKQASNKFAEKFSELKGRK